MANEVWTSAFNAAWLAVDQPGHPRSELSSGAATQGNGAGNQRRTPVSPERR